MRAYGVGVRRYYRVRARWKKREHRGEYQGKSKAALQGASKAVLQGASKAESQSISRESKV